MTRPGLSRFALAVGSAALVAVALIGGPAMAEDNDKDKEFKEKSAYGPIQKRAYEMSHEVSLGWSYLPLDPYYKGYGASLAYTIHINHMFALELFRVGFSWNKDTSLKTKLIDQMPDISPEEFPAVVFFENTNLLFKLLYGKQTFLNRTVLHYELFITAGAALAFRNPFNFNDLDMENARYDFGIDAGVGFRFWLSPSWSVRFDIRDTVLLLSLNSGSLPLKNSAEIGLAIAVNL